MWSRRRRPRPRLSARAAAARRHADHAPGVDDATLEMSPFEELKIDKRRPASLRAIDESDPFK